MSEHFKNDMRRITEHTGRKTTHRQTVLVSATITPEFVTKLGDWCPATDFVFVGLEKAVGALTHGKRGTGEGRRDGPRGQTRGLDEEGSSSGTDPDVGSAEPGPVGQPAAPHWGWNQNSRQKKRRDVKNEVSGGQLCLHKD